MNRHPDVFFLIRKNYVMSRSTVSSAVSSSLPYSFEKKRRYKLKHTRTPGTTNIQYLSCLLVSSATAEQARVYFKMPTARKTSFVH